MVTRVKATRDDTMLAGYQPMPERAPSVTLESKPTMMRFLFIVGVLLTTVGMFSLLAVEWGFRYRVSPDWGMVFLSIGLGLIFLHAFSEKEEQFRVAYGVVGAVIIFLSASLRVLPIGGPPGARFLSIGLPGLCVGLTLIGAMLRHEAKAERRNIFTAFLLAATALLLLAGYIMVYLYLGDNIGQGVVLLILGLAYAMVTMTFQSERAAYLTSLGLGGFGLICIATGALRYFGSDTWVPSGISLVLFGVAYLFVFLGVASDWQVVVLTRRELAGFFYSPIAYPVLLGLTVIAWLNFYFFVSRIVGARGMLFEPIVAFYIVSLVPVIAQMFLVPVLTMRLLSEEQRSGTLEVLLTAPVNEGPIVLSKFLGAMFFYMLTWVPAVLFLVSLRVVGGEDFDYRPMLSFLLAVVASGAGFIAMGLFCSAVTRNQIIAAVLCFAGMMGHLAIYLIKSVVESPQWQDLLTYMSFIDLWFDSLQGQVAPRLLCFHVTLAVFFLFLSMKVLESRKWK